MSTRLERFLDLIASVVRKNQPTSSDVHVESPLGNQRKVTPPLDNLEATILKAALDSETRNDLADSSFAMPKERRYPIHDISHARNALARSSGKPEEETVRRAVYRKYPSLKPEPAKKKVMLRRSHASK